MIRHPTRKVCHTESQLVPRKLQVPFKYRKSQRHPLHSLYTVFSITIHKIRIGPKYSTRFWLVNLAEIITGRLTRAFEDNNEMDPKCLLDGV